MGSGVEVETLTAIFAMATVTLLMVMEHVPTMETPVMFQANAEIINVNLLGIVNSYHHKSMAVRRWS